MALIVEDGSGIAGANSYATEAEVSAYFSLRGVSSWAAATLPEREAAIVKGTAWLDSAYGWRGVRQNASQGLAWPRLDAYDDDGYIQLGIPVALRNATAEAAIRALTGELAPDKTSGAVIEEAVGPVRTKYSAPNVSPTYPVIARLVAGLRKGSSGSVRLNR